MKNIFILLDAGYLNNYRFYATKIWYKNAHPDDYPEDELNYVWSENNVFLEKYKKIYEETIINLKMKYKCDFSNMFIACDCRRHNIWRVPLFNDYKANRIKLKKTKNVGSDLQKYSYTNLLPYVSNKLKINRLSHNNAEADDIIAIITKYIRRNDKNAKILIIANDKDYLQLVDDKEKIDILNINGKSILSNSVGTNKEDLLSKIILGDPADNIKGCFNRCGEKTSIKYAKDSNLLEAAFNKQDGSKKKFDLNSLIIDFENIPKEIVDYVESIVVKIIKFKKVSENKKITSFFEKK